MKIVRLGEVKGEKFAAGRWTRVLIGPGAVEAKNFVMGYVIIYPDGSIPLNDHEQEEVYLILQGKGLMRVGDEEQEVEATTAIYIPPGEHHQLKNTGTTDLILIFIYSPGGPVSHWQQERDGKFKVI